MDTPDEEELQNDLESHEESQDYNANETPCETLAKHLRLAPNLAWYIVQLSLT